MLSSRSVSVVGHWSIALRGTIQLDASGVVSLHMDATYDPSSVRGALFSDPVNQLLEVRK